MSSWWHKVCITALTSLGFVPGGEAERSCRSDSGLASFLGKGAFDV